MDKMFGDFEDNIREKAERLLELDTFNEILHNNDLTRVDVLVFLIEAGLIDTEHVE